MNTQPETPPSHPESLELIYALNAVATTLQHSIQDEDNIYTVFTQQIVRLGLRGGISLYDKSSSTLTFKTIAFPNPLRKILSRFEKDLDTRAEGYSVSVANVDVYQRVVEKSESVFIPDTSSVSSQVTPRAIKGIITPLLKFLGSPPGIFTPLIFEGQVMGMLNIVGRNLTKNDVPTMQAFANQIAVALENARLMKNLQTAHDDLEAAYQATLEGWVDALDLRDNETEGHSQRVAELTVDLAAFVGIQSSELPHIRRGALLHDIGKMAVPDGILRKPGPLSDAEWSVMKLHPVNARQWLSRILFLNPALEIPYNHHERWDGSGYPRGLARDEIPFSARIFAIVDVWDAMCSDRPYRKAIPEKQVIQHIQEQDGQLFDPKAVQAFMDFRSKR
jgi:HD-GYP domain-containing protein (c-di-GMP phosphodiesterase class II)